MKTDFFSEWERMKKAFGAAAKTITAFAKEQGEPVTEAQLNYSGRRERISVLLAKVMPKITEDSLSDAVLDLMAGLPALEKSTQQKLKQSNDDKAEVAWRVGPEPAALVRDQLAEEHRPAGQGPPDSSHGQN